MPNRLLKEGINDSAKINRLDWPEEVFFYRLLVIADDYGRVDARPAILRARCFPLKESLTNNQVEKWLMGLQSAALLYRYQVGSEVFAEIANWEQRVRTRGKYPPPSDGKWLTIDGQLTDICPQPADNCLTGDGVGKGRGKGKGASNEKISFDAATGAWLGIEETQRGLWSIAYPAIDLGQELAKAASWLVSNPKNQKSNYARFLNNWFTKAQDKAARVPSVSTAKPWDGAQ